MYHRGPLILAFPKFTQVTRATRRDREQRGGIVNGGQKEGLLEFHSIHRSVEIRRDPPPRTDCVSRRRQRHRHSKATHYRETPRTGTARETCIETLNGKAIAIGCERSPTRETRTRISLIYHRSATFVYEIRQRELAGDRLPALPIPFLAFKPLRDAYT